jgi:hypothetical protein
VRVCLVHVVYAEMKFCFVDIFFCLTVIEANTCVCVLGAWTLVMRGIRVPDRETKKAPKIQKYRSEIGLHLEKVDKDSQKKEVSKKNKESKNLNRNYKSLALMVLGMMLLLVAVVITMRLIN